MYKRVKRTLMIIPMMLFLCFSFLGIKSYAVDNVDKSSSSSTTNASDTTTTKTEDTPVYEINTGNTSANSTSTQENSTSSKSGSNSTKNANSEAQVKKDPVTGDTQTTQNDSTKQTTDNVEKETLPAWKNMNGKLYYVTKDGIVKKTGWFKEKDVNSDAKNDNEYYLGDDFAAIIGWKEIDGSWYYFDESGIKQTGWKVINYNWYFLDKDGIMETGWIKNDGNTYYLNSEGIMSLGKKYIDDKWYFFGNDGILEKGMYIYNGKIYCSDNNGVMVANQWIETRKYKYYVKADSALATGDAIIDGKMEKFDDEGRYQGEGEMTNHLYVKYLSVGNADCAFIKLPDGETALIDTGDTSTADDVVNFLNDQDLKEEDGKPVIDYIVITHGHSDHIGGLSTIINKFKVKKVYMPEIADMKDWYSNLKVTSENASSVELMKHDYEVYTDAINAMKKKDMDFINTVKGQYIDNNKILQFVQSDKNFGGIGADKETQYYWGINENSAIIYLNYGDFQSLFAADMEWNSEKDFWTNNLLEGKHVDVLKVPHHGHDTSSTSDFIAYVKPTMGVISRDKDSIEKGTAYNNLLKNGVTIYETSDRENGIGIYANQQNWTVQK